MIDLPDKIELEFSDNNTKISKTSLINWLKNEIEFAEDNRVQASNLMREIEDKESSRYKWQSLEIMRAEHELVILNHLLTDLGEPYYNGKRP